MNNVKITNENIIQGNSTSNTIVIGFNEISNNIPIEIDSIGMRLFLLNRKI